MFAPNLQTQHYQLAEMRQLTQTMPLDYASYQIHTDQLEGAIVTLKLGRPLLWSELRSFRPTTAQLSQAWCMTVKAALVTSGSTAR